MQYSTEIPVYFIRLLDANGKEILTPLNYSRFAWHGNDSRKMPAAFAAAIQTDLIKNGDLSQVFYLQQDWLLIPCRQPINIGKSTGNKKSTTFPLLFDFYVRETEDQRFISYVPAIGIEVYSETDKNIIEDVTVQIQSEFIRAQRFADIRRLIETQWFQQSTAQKHNLSLTFYTPKELKAMARSKQDPILPRVAHLFSTTYLPVIDLEDETRELNNVLNSRFAQSALVVANEGCGKTALINEFVRLRQNSPGRIWETTAAKLLQGLSGDTGWQQGLALLVNELRHDNAILYVDHLIELFEVGQYEGNNISIGETLKEPLQRGEITLVAEATEDEVAAVNLRAPGFCDLLVHITLKKKSDEELEHIVSTAVSNLAQQHQQALEEDAFYEVLRLQRRYAPYSGMPGKTIRFFETLILQHKDTDHTIDRQAAIKGFCEETGLPAFIVDPDIAFSTTDALRFLKARIFGQDQASELIVQLLTAVKTAMLRADKPIASLLFVGPTGVGKTEMAKTLAEFMFGDRQRILRFDMSEFSDAAAVMRLTGEWGAAEGSLVSQIRQQPFSVLLLDEIEKAHFTFFDLLLQVLGEGRLTDPRGNVANFCSSIVIMTSNIGASEFSQGSIGFHSDHKTQHSVADTFNQAVQDYFRPELINRLDQIVPFAPLEIEQQTEIVKRELHAINNLQGIQTRKVEFQFSTDAARLLAEMDQDNRYGAMQLQRLIREKVVIDTAKIINNVQHHHAYTIALETENNAISFKISTQAASLDQSHSIMELATRISTHRKLLSDIVDGVLFNKLLSELDILTTRSKQKDFWKNKIQSNRYLKLQKVAHATQQLEDEVNEIETRVLCDILDVEHNGYRPLDKEFTHWHQRYHLQLRSLYAHAVPESNFCIIGLYGVVPVVKQALAYYRNLVKAGGFVDSLYAVVIKEEEYHHLPTPLTGEDQRAKPVGALLAISGEAAWMYFHQEGGLQQWSVSGHSNSKLFVIIDQCPLEEVSTPDNIHRLHFYEGIKPRRIFQNTVMDDKIYATQWQHLDDFSELLQQRFDRNIEQALVDEE